MNIHIIFTTSLAAAQNRLKFSRQSHQPDAASGPERLLPWLANLKGVVAEGTSKTNNMGTGHLQK